MKCPYQTITKTEQLFASNGSVTTTTFTDCIRNECPFYGWEELRNKMSGGIETVTIPGCRRARDNKNDFYYCGK